MRMRDESIPSARFIEAAKAAGADIGLLLQAAFLPRFRSVAV
jgi:hypothetical protein